MPSFVDGSTEHAASPWPPIGLGCSPIGPDGSSRDLVPVLARALALGYRLYDTAELYGSERLIGQALAARPARRETLFLVSKLWSTHHRPALVRAACLRSLRALGVGHLDLYLIHTPRPWRPCAASPCLRSLAQMQAQARAGDDDPTLLPDCVPLADTWAALEALRDAGLVRAIGVSNFERGDLETLLAAGAQPAVNQIARDPMRPRHRLVAFCRRRGIAIMAHSPLAAAGLLHHPQIVEMARHHQRSPAQIVLRWQIEGGITPLPGTRRSDHLEDNFATLGFRLEPAEIACLDRLGPDEQPGPGYNLLP